ncbi:DUF1090 domain-containing protein [Vibrio lentus]|uniref:DUF1090 domain-containing protein n=1 Tax=Vibrio lentus TaxID=136468 RepID=UPI000C84836F|nr:DUF1090 domain-containing protein [Vibrio lentus]PMG24586.1 hypothetical protein BCU96_03745 [Vibrio lentus]PMH08780.1 hypothetical protein BCU76_05385 [Vibrio lentus]PMJ14593.1 hypothetical protein BCU30_01835 [Vibrio lentus]PMK92734.1 hypothetical protein BCT89_19780 [Vibrio lentus]PMN19112.1 hypothetical protein BCT39_02775 [Vibrio lentus]
MSKHTIKVLLPLLLLPLSAFASDCQKKIGCEKKACEIEMKIEIAKANGYDNKLEGLTDALDQVNTYCTNEELKSELIDDIEDAQEEIVEYKEELQEAQDFNEDDKVAKYQRKISEEKAKVEEYKQELSTLD